MVRRQCCLLLWVFLLAPTGALCVVNYFHFSKRNSCLSTLSQLQSFWPKLISSQSFVCSELLLEGSSALKETRQLIFFFQLGKPPVRGFLVYSHCQRSIFNIILKSWYFTLPFNTTHPSKHISTRPGNSLDIFYGCWLSIASDCFLLGLPTTPGTSSEGILQSHICTSKKKIFPDLNEEEKDKFSASFKLLLTWWKNWLIKW